MGQGWRGIQLPGKDETCFATSIERKTTTIYLHIQCSSVASAAESATHAHVSNRKPKDRLSATN